jgi:hypothetical protein
LLAVSAATDGVIKLFAICGRMGTPLATPSVITVGGEGKNNLRRNNRAQKKI